MYVHETWQVVQLHHGATIFCMSFGVVHGSFRIHLSVLDSLYPFVSQTLYIRLFVSDFKQKIRMWY